MTTITVVLDDHLNEAGKERTIQAIEMIKGVKYIAGTGGEQGVPSPTPERQDRIQAVFDEVSPNQSAGPSVQPENLSGSRQQFFISEVIGWAARNRILNMEDVKQWSPEEIVQQALRLFETMPPEIQKTIGEKVAAE